ncbi:hypothetical protein QF026_004792 [Streptomyces aurantiacus]|uniref:hypothetical protein n=1 Tax=Streptomyces aurantiacus TaxID=47760 RepID=UPI0027917AFE|nr:hypothetical protein [Streptomyces aurantiacus]MDQ0776326.1 hypothetical protein [Streptomyces aurantiacus]
MPEDEYFDYSDELLPLGFTPGEAIIENDPSNLKVEDFRDSLFGSTATEPKTVSIRVTRHGDTVAITVDLIRAIWVVNDGIKAPVEQRVYHDIPNWYIEGQVVMSSVRVRIRLIAVSGSYIDCLALQFIRDEHAKDGIVRAECID